jgi:hypothetical protein
LVGDPVLSGPLQPVEEVVELVVGEDQLALALTQRPSSAPGASPAVPAAAAVGGRALGGESEVTEILISRGKTFFFATRFFIFQKNFLRQAFFFFQ